MVDKKKAGKKPSRKAKRKRYYRRITVPFPDFLAKKVKFYAKFLGYEHETAFIRNAVIEKITKVELEEKKKESIGEQLMRKYKSLV